MRYLGIDASTKSTGISIFDEDKLIAYNCLTASSADVIKRIQIIIDKLDKVIEIYKPDIIIIEEVIPKSHEDNFKTIHTQRVLTWMQAAINFLCHEKYPNIKIDYIYPNEWRAWIGIKTGAGIRREFLKTKDIEWVKNKFNLILSDDEADAIGIICGYRNMLEGEYPKPVLKKPHGAW